MLVKAFRLFVSSTFADFKLERDVLQTKVFPALDRYCSAKGYQFYAVDLRWGVNEEAHLDQRTAEICLGEVRAAKSYPPPNFPVMTGNRYGWVPLPYAITADEFCAIFAWLTQHDQQDEIGALLSVYGHDENYLVPRGLLEEGRNGGALTGAYTLRSREFLPGLKHKDAWEEFEARLSQILQKVADRLLAAGKTSPAAHKKYFVSLTEQEVPHGLSHGR